MSDTAVFKVIIPQMCKHPLPTQFYERNLRHIHRQRVRKGAEPIKSDSCGKPGSVSLITPLHRYTKYDSTACALTWSIRWWHWVVWRVGLEPAQTTTDSNYPRNGEDVAERHQSFSRIVVVNIFAITFMFSSFSSRCAFVTIVKAWNPCR